jgi:DNA-binding NarL/FixJ family response regulator
MACCGETNGVTGTTQAVQEHQPDLVLLDLTLKDGSGLELLVNLVGQFRGLRVLVLSQHDEATHAEMVLRNGAQGYVMKQEATNDVLKAIRAVLAGEIYLSHQMSARLIRKLTSSQPPPFGNLTSREREVLQLIGGGLSTKEIAHELKLSVKTVETYREHLKSKLGLPNGAKLVEFAVRNVSGEFLASPPPS